MRHRMIILVCDQHVKDVKGDKMHLNDEERGKEAGCHKIILAKKILTSYQVNLETM